MASGRNTQEYRKMLESTPSLTNVLADGTNVVRLAGELVRAGLINKANERRMLNLTVDAEVRAADLIGMVTTKVELNPQNFTTFIRVLEKDQATYGDVLINMRTDETTPIPKHIMDTTALPGRQPNAAGLGRSVPSSLKRYAEFDILQQFHAALNSAIIDPDVFASSLIAKGFMTRQGADNLMPLGLSNYRKVGNLLGVVDSHIKSARVVSYEHVRDKFSTFLCILGSQELGLYDIAKEMEEKCYGTQRLPLIEPQQQIPATGTGGLPQPQHTPVPQPLHTPAPQPNGAASPQPQQVQVQAVDIPRIFKVDMTIEQLALWLSCHEKLVGDFGDDINILKGAKINGHSFLHLSDAGLQHLEVSFGFSLILLDIIKELKVKQQQSLGNEDTPQPSPTTDANTAASTTHSNTTSTTNVPSIQTQPGPYKRLRDEDHNIIYSKISDHADRWIDLGIALGFKQTELNLIRVNPMLFLQSPPQSHLREMLSQWLQWGPGDGRGSPDFANSVALYKALLKINLAPVAYELDRLLAKH